MFRKIFSQDMDINTYGTISLLLFVGVFTYILIRMFTYRKSYINEMSSLPLDEETTASDHA